MVKIVVHAGEGQAVQQAAAAGAGAGGLMAMLGQMAQSPAMQQMVGQLVGGEQPPAPSGETSAGSDLHVHTYRSLPIWSFWAQGFASVT